MVRWLALLLLAGACARPREPMLLVAASLLDAVPEVYAGTEVRTSFAASSTLARQIDHGLEADLFLSADREWVEYLRRRGRGVEVSEFLRNVLVAWTRKDRPAPRGREELADPRWGRIAVGDTAVPVGRYARAALEGLDLKGRLLPCRNARAVVAALAAGEARVGLAYATDARPGDGLAVAFRFDRPGDPQVGYWALLCRDRPEARRLLAKLTDARAARIFSKHGFLPVP